MHLVVGKGGQLGTSFGNLLGSEVEIVGMDQLDLVETDKIAPTLDRFQPETLINCAAATGVDDAEEDEDLDDCDAAADDVRCVDGVVLEGERGADDYILCL